MLNRNPPQRPWSVTLELCMIRYTAVSLSPESLGNQTVGGTLTTPVPPKPKGFSFNVGTALKAIYAGFGAALAGLSSALLDAHTVSAITDAQWIAIGGFAFASFGAVYGVTNTPKS